MSLVTESGSGLANAESYCDVAYADARHAALGNTAWAGLDTDAKEAALRNGANYMVGAYRARWGGYRVTAAQALDWPRSGVVVDGFAVSSTIVPVEIKNANADLALKASAAVLAPDIERAVVREKIGPLETEYSEYATQATAYRAIDMMLRPYLKGSAAMACLVR